MGRSGIISAKSHRRIVNNAMGKKMFRFCTQNVHPTGQWRQSYAGVGTINNRFRGRLA